jgi:malonate-semialdehyde dehydrogenase (acetylating) / methylmalonate-semialdehyde dehydrogenase
MKIKGLIQSAQRRGLSPSASSSLACRARTSWTALSASDSPFNGAALPTVTCVEASKLIRSTAAASMSTASKSSPKSEVPSWCTAFPPAIPSDAAWFDQPTQQYKVFTDNHFVLASSSTDTSNNNNNNSSSKSNSQSNPQSPVTNPATQQVLGHVPNTPPHIIDNVMNKAQVAFEAWQHVSVQQRQRLLFQYLHLIRQHKDALAYLITLENGKTLVDAQGDVFRGIEVVETACQVTPHMSGSAYAGLSTHVDMTTVREPLGVCVGVTPFNFPAMIPLWMFPLAIATGNTFVLKPSEKTPSTAMYLGQLWQQALDMQGMSKSHSNLLQIVHGDAQVANALVTDKRSRALSFVGSTRAGLALAKLAANQEPHTRCQANLGAKNHAVVLPDAMRPATARALAGAALGAAGQRCMALSVVLLVRTNHGETTTSNESSTDDALDVFVQEIVKCAQAYKVGPGWQSDTDIGPLISKASQERVMSIVKQSQEQGAQVIHGSTGDSKLTVAGYEEGNFVGPTILKLPSTDNVAYQEEIFGPVLSILYVDTLEDALLCINNETPYGNGTAIFTDSGSAARYFTRHVQVGQVGINVPIPVPLPMGSFTGSRASFHGDINFYGPSGVQFYTQLKTVTSQWIYEALPLQVDSSRPMNVESQPKGKQPRKKDGPDLGGVSMPTVK